MPSPCGPQENHSGCITSSPSSSSPDEIESTKTNKSNTENSGYRKDEIDANNTERDMVLNKIAHKEEIAQIRYSMVELKQSIDDLDEIIEIM